jgi:hypothetical protein
MPDDWEIDNALNPGIADDRNIVGSDGYTMLEKYLNGLASNTDTKKLCSPASFTVVSNVRGSVYQWEESQGAGFSMMAGQTDSVLTIPVVSSAYGFKYRCRVNGNQYSKTHIIQFESKWTGATSSAWEQASNWSCNQVPDEEHGCNY